MDPSQISLNDKYKFQSEPVFLTGTQALVRLAMMQRIKDQKAGLNTHGFVSGYRGSPLGNVDLEFWRAKPYLEPYNIHFHPGLNEDLAATSIWGTQQVSLDSQKTCDGVFSIWYGKGPGVDRTGDVFRHANAAGTSKYGGVLVIAGDDHAAKSSTFPHQTEHVFKSMMMPILSPSDIKEYLEYGLHGFALSRYSGCWVAFKALSDTVETSASVQLDPLAVDTKIPVDFNLPEDGLNLRWPDPPLEQEKRLLNHKLYAALAYCRVNNLNKTVFDSPVAKLGILTSGKSYLDVRQALQDLAIDEQVAFEVGIRLYKVGMVWPLEPEGIRQFSVGLDEILVVEEKRQFLEYQLKEELYNWSESVRPRVIGKFDEKGEWAFPHSHWLLPAAGELTPAMIARVIAQRISRFHSTDKIQRRLSFLNEKEAKLSRLSSLMERSPHYCSGCPHNISTKVPAGSKALAGIGCHYMATWLSPESTQTFCQMGGEGIAWVGQSRFTTRKHVFTNLGDGTYMHSGILAIRAALAAKINITYKILFNDAVAMTGGQPHDGVLTVPHITRQLQAEGVKEIVIVSDEPEKFYKKSDLAIGVEIYHRDQLDQVQKKLRDLPGVTALIYDQTCAAEKRRRRKRGKLADIPTRVFINDRVCEGCGHCSEKSNCISVVNIETEFGNKRMIDQSGCNKDFSCINGFCPSFVTIQGGILKKSDELINIPNELRVLPEPSLPQLAQPYSIMLTGVGGTGIVTIGAILGMAAHIENKGVTVLDMAGLSQKGGAVFSHVRIAQTADSLFAARISAGEANLVIGCDIMVTASNEALAKMRHSFTQAVVNRSDVMTSQMVRNFAHQARHGDTFQSPDLFISKDEMVLKITDSVGSDQVNYIDANFIVSKLLGDSVAVNMFMLGFAWQKGLVPLAQESIMRSIEINGVAIEQNKKAFIWGRRSAANFKAINQLITAENKSSTSPPLSLSIEQLISRRVDQLIQYQNKAYADRYLRVIENFRVLEQKLFPGHFILTEAVARGYYKLLAYKDEYEVARLFSDGQFIQNLNNQFEGNFKVNFHLAPPIFNSKHINSEDLPQKSQFGPWMLSVMTILSKFSFLRGTKFDPFGYSSDRKLDRDLISRYEDLLNFLIEKTNRENFTIAVELASLPDGIRGFGLIRHRFASRVKEQQELLMEKFQKLDFEATTSKLKQRQPFSIPVVTE